MAERIVIGLEYDGRAFCGWQTQPGACAVQDVLEAALAQIHAGPVQTIVAGRTDAGVHALAQVAHFDVTRPRPLSAWVRGVNTLLPEGVAVLWSQSVAPEFNARYSATERSYRYLLFNHPIRPALLAGRVGWVHAPLDALRMAEAAGLLLGEHDFSAFRAAECQAKSPVRELREARVERHGDFLLFEFRANAFLHHQVRNMVGALVWIGLGRRPVEWLAEVLASCDRTRAAATFSGDGLYLAGVKYDPSWALPTIEHRLPWMPT